MIRWCAYCQTLMGEAPPLTSFELSHGICKRCSERLEAGEPIVAQNRAIVRFYKELFTAAMKGDQSTCAELARRGAEAGYGPAELLVGVMQPALVEIGRRWEKGLVTVADEHRFTAWCETMLAILDRPAAPKGKLDLLIVSAPGNRHDLGARMAEQVLLARGVRVQTIVPDLPDEELFTVAQRRRASWVGFSCARAEDVDAARAQAAELAARGYTGRVMLSGQALRRAPEGWPGLEASICLTLDEARELISGRQTRSTRA